MLRLFARQNLRNLTTASSTRSFLPSTSAASFSATTSTSQSESSPLAQQVHHPHQTKTEVRKKDVFAIIKLSGSQYKVTSGDTLTVNKVPGANVSETMHIDDVLLIGTPNETIVGRPMVSNARVTLEVEEQKKDKKVLVYKKKRRQGYQRKNGARRHITVFRVSDISY